MIKRPSLFAVVSQLGFLKENFSDIESFDNFLSIVTIKNGKICLEQQKSKSSNNKQEEDEESDEEEEVNFLNTKRILQNNDTECE